MEYGTREKTFFIPGDIVTIRHNIPFKPIMWVEGKETKLIKKDDASHFIGMKCSWFNTNLELQKAVISTKDLVHYKEDPHGNKGAN